MKRHALVARCSVYPRGAMYNMSSARQPQFENVTPAIQLRAPSKIGHFTERGCGSYMFSHRDAVSTWIKEVTVVSTKHYDMAPRQNIIGPGYTLGDSWVYPFWIYAEILGIPGKRRGEVQKVCKAKQHRGTPVAPPFWHGAT